MTLEPQEIVSGKNLAAKSAEVDFAIVLSRVIVSIENDPAQLRNVVYELARIKLQTELSQREVPINVSEKRDLASALESAIERVMTLSSKHDHLRVLRSPHTTHPPSFLSRVVGGSRKVEAAPLARAVMVAILAVVLCAVLDRQFGFFGRQGPQPFASVHKIERLQAKPVVQASADTRQMPVITPSTQSLGFPLPTVYGIYAISGGQLHELEPLVGRVPDQRVFMSTPIKTASRTVLPDGRAAFIIYRRDAANSAPERVSVRVIAKVLRAMTFNTAGHASTMNVQDTWTIRNISYDFRVAPLGEGSEMLMIKPENEDFVFPAGRYGLVIKGQ